ncbi:MAG TPA: LacI family DNA-binding transcriptional regulator [Opitutaceae bacterium]|nr:LacI family DNA-binding transcriptional regulator [Opitutaceae bacterium]
MPNLNKHKPVRAATLADVGKVAGVSAMAASVVLNGAKTSSRIAPETRDRILEAAAALRYRPNAAARALANRRMDTLGIAAVVDEGELNHYFLEVFNGILEGAAHHEQNATVFTLHDWGRDPARLHQMCDGRIDGLILVAPTLTRAAAKLLPAHTPFVALHANEALPNVVNIESDEERGAFEMVRHLVAQGHRRIMHVSGPAAFTGAQRRIQGYKLALAKARIPFQSDLVISADFSTASGRDVLRAWLRNHAGERLPQAIFCANDSVAVGCLEALAEVGLRVPEDISIAGFDDSLLARTTVPQLTTVRQPLRAMGHRAVKEILARIEQREGGHQTSSFEPIVFPVDLVPRASVAAPPAAARIVPRARHG